VESCFIDITLRMAASPRSFAIAKLPDTVRGTLQSIPLQTNVEENKANYSTQLVH